MLRVGAACPVACYVARGRNQRAPVMRLSRFLMARAYRISGRISGRIRGRTMQERRKALRELFAPKRLLY